jgi:hypothetical protein
LQAQVSAVLLLEAQALAVQVSVLVWAQPEQAAQVLAFPPSAPVWVPALAQAAELPLRFLSQLSVALPLVREQAAQVSVRVLARP